MRYKGGFFSGPVAGYSRPAGLSGIRLELAAHPVLPLADRQVAVLLSLCVEGGRLAEAVSGQAGGNAGERRRAAFQGQQQRKPTLRVMAAATVICPCL